MAAFEPYGEVVGAKIVRDKETNRSKGFGFIEMTNDADGIKAIEALNGTDLSGRNMIVSEAKPRENDGNSSTPPNSQDWTSFATEWFAS